MAGRLAGFTEGTQQTGPPGLPIPALAPADSPFSLASSLMARRPPVGTKAGSKLSEGREMALVLVQ